MIDVALRQAVPGFALDVAFRNVSGLTALFGRSGSGKSMTLGLIAGLMKPDAGHVRVGETVLVETACGIDVPMHRRRVGLVFQDALLFPHLTVRQNLAFGRWFAPRGRHAIGFETVVDTLGIGALLPRRPGLLSGGERQRVAIGRALLADPRLLLLDEPLAALDRARKLEILPLIERIRDEIGIPIVYVCHAVEEVARLASHVVVLNEGRVTASGDPAVVLGGAAASAEPRFGRVSILEAVVGGHDEAFGLTALRHPSGTLWLAGAAGQPGTKVKALVPATDVSLAVGAVGALSIRSRLAGIVAGVTPEGPLAAVEVALDGGGALLALVTRRAVEELELRSGTKVQALIKTVALDEGQIPRG